MRSVAFVPLIPTMKKTEKLFASINFVADKSVERQQKNSRSVEKENKKNAEIRRVQPTDHTATTEKQQQQQQQKKKGKIDILCTDKSYMHSGKTYIVLGEHSLSLYLSLRCITSAHENLAFGKTIETRLRIIAKAIHTFFTHLMYVSFMKRTDSLRSRCSTHSLLLLKPQPCHDVCG